MLNPFDTDLTEAQTKAIQTARNTKAAIRALPLKQVDSELVRRVNTARITLTGRKPFEAALLSPMRLAFVNSGIPTAATDCWRRIWLNAEFIKGYNVRSVETVLAHEAYHAALMHGVRLGGRKPQLHNVACDLQINAILKTRGFSFDEFDTVGFDETVAMIATQGAQAPASSDRMQIFLEPSFGPDITSEQIYAKLLDAMPPQQQQQQGGAQGAGGEGSGDNPFEGKFGGDDVRPDMQGQDDGSDSESNGDGKPDGKSDGGGKAPTQADLQREMGQRVSAGAVAEKSHAKRRGGHIDAWTQRFIDESLKDQVSWKTLLQRFVRASLNRDDYSMRRPSRRGLARGVVLPSLRSEAVERIAVVSDTSGSVDNHELSMHAAEVAAIIERAKVKETHLAFVDTAVRNEQVFKRYEPVVFKPAGGGGTDMRKGFEWMATKKPQLGVMFTDGCTGWPDEKPDFPCVVVLTGSYTVDRSSVPEWAHVVEIT